MTWMDATLLVIVFAQAVAIYWVWDDARARRKTLINWTTSLIEGVEDRVFRLEEKTKRHDADIERLTEPTEAEVKAAVDVIKRGGVVMRPDGTLETPQDAVDGISQKGGEASP